VLPWRPQWKRESDPAVTVSRWRRGPVDALTGESGDTLLRHTAERAELHLRNGRLVPGRGYTDAPAEVRRELARLAAMLRLRQRGRFHVHAAGVVAPDGGAWILAGESGNGKSTLAYALARRGWLTLGDDGVLVERSNEGIIARSWREPMQVSIDLAFEFPELASSRAATDWNDPRRRVAVAPPGGTASSAPVRGLALLSRSTRDSLIPASPTDVLAALIRQSPTVLLGGRHAIDQLDTLGTLVTSVPVYRLEHTERQLHILHQTLTEGLC
jgi:hypothetical protein